MINKILKNYGYIKRDKIKIKVENEILKSNEKIISKMTNEFNIAKENYISEEKSETSIAIGKLNAEIAELIQENKKLKKEVNSSRKAYKIYRDNALNLKTIGENLGAKVDEILKKSGYFFREIKEVEKIINNHVMITLCDDSLNSKLLKVKQLER